MAIMKRLVGVYFLSGVSRPAVNSLMFFNCPARHPHRSVPRLTFSRLNLNRWAA